VNTEKKEKKCIEIMKWIIVLGTIFIPLVSFLYIDTNSIIRCGIDVFKSLFEGEIFDYYKYAGQSRDAGLMVHPPTYDFIFYVTVGIWELPIAVLELVLGKDFERNTYVLIYSKIFLFVFILLTAWMIYKIAKELQFSEKNAKCAVFMYMTSGLIVAYTCIAGQYDIMGIFFSLVGVYFYLKGDMKKFGLMFVLAIQYKFFAVFIFLPLLLLKEKKMVKIICYILPCVASIILFRIPFVNDGEVMIEKNDINAGMFDKILGFNIPTEAEQISLSLLAVGAVCLYCYFKEVNDEDRKYYAIYIPFLTLGVLFLTFSFYPYWFIYIVPWIPLLFFMRDDMKENLLWLETGMVAMILLFHYAKYDWVFDIDNMENMFLCDLVHDIYRFKIDLTRAYKPVVEEYTRLFYSFFWLFLAALLVVLKPKKGVAYKLESEEWQKKLWIRFLGQNVISNFPIILYFINFFKMILMK